MKKYKRQSYTLDIDSINTLNKWARNLHISKSEVIRKLISMYDYNMIQAYKEINNKEDK